mgnify:CR=1 FL=1
MLKRKTKNNNGRKGQLLIVGSFLIIIGIGILGGKIVNNYLDKKQEQDLIKDFYEQQEEYVVDVPVMEEELVEEEVVEQEEKKETKIEFIYLDELQVIKRKGMQPVDIPRCCKLDDYGISITVSAGYSQLENKIICFKLLEEYKRICKEMNLKVS